MWYIFIETSLAQNQSKIDSVTQATLCLYSEEQRALGIKKNVLRDKLDYCYINISWESYEKTMLMGIGILL